MRKRVSLTLLVTLLVVSLSAIGGGEAANAVTSKIFGTTGSFPIGITVDTSGNVFTTNFLDDTVTKITPMGVSTVFATTGDGPYSIAMDKHGNLYTANDVDDTVSKITPSGVSTIFGTTGSVPASLVIDSRGNVYACNFYSNTVTKITPQGVSTTLGTTGDHPYKIAMDSAGNIYTSNLYSNTVTKITPQGVSTTFGTTGLAPQGIVVDQVGNVYTSNTGDDTITKITPDGSSSIFATTGDTPFSLAIDNQGNLFSANYVSNDITEISPNGTSTELGPAGNGPVGITLDQLGNVYVANGLSNNVTEFLTGTQPNAEIFIPAQTDSIASATAVCSPSDATITLNGSFMREVSNVAVGSDNMPSSNFTVGSKSIVVKLNAPLETPKNVYVFNGAAPVLSALVQPCASASVANGHGSLTASVSFAAGSAKLSPSQLAKLKAFIAKYALATKSGLSVTVVGLGDKKLPIARARAIAAKLSALGITAKAKVTSRSVANPITARKVLISFSW